MSQFTLFPGRVCFNTSRTVRSGPADRSRRCIFRQL